ncbi:hypothetical protein EY643_02915 [Halioglobus maricola]|uniref:Uncharacterized protein n=2 Tax=Halioglobus maricola TaxID=2601894 RepID=A0A5P9NGM0_9GAMM|nr:hypothetical protein EY643_02915 [Halioglobus maricola]
MAHEPEYRQLQLFDREPHNALALKMLAEFKGNSGPVSYYGELPSSEEMLENIGHQLHSHRPHTVVLCAEAFANFGDISDTLIERLRDTFSDFDITLYCTLRRVDHYLPSWYAQCINFGRRLAPLRGGGFDSFVDTIHIDYCRLLNPWLRLIPDANLILRDYDEVLEAGGSIPDFLASIQLESHSMVVVPCMLNSGIPHRFIEICRVANWELDAKDSARLRQGIVSLANEAVVDAKPRPDLLGKNRDKLAVLFDPVDRSLGQLIGRERFFSPATAQPPLYEEGKVFTSAVEELAEALVSVRVTDRTRRYVSSLDLASMGRYN